MLRKTKNKTIIKMRIIWFIIYCTFFILTLAVNDFEFRNFSCEASALNTIEIRVCECKKKTISLDLTISRPMSNWNVNNKYFIINIKSTENVSISHF